jgi:energy-converting hydrogenase Eha subunit G
MADIEAKSELGGSLMFIGLALWVADLLVFFYLPAALKLGRHLTFVGIIAVLAVMGLVLMITGYGLRRKNEAS